MNSKHVKDSALSPEVQKYAEKLRASTLYEKYYYRFGKFMRKTIHSTEIQHTTEALRFFNDLKLKMDKLATKNIEVASDVQTLKNRIDEVISVCIQDDGIISSSEFDVFFNIIYGIYQGMANLVGKNLNDSQRLFYDYFLEVTGEKPAFRRSIMDRENPTVTLKGLLSLGTSYAICLEKLKDETTSSDIAYTTERFGKKKKKPAMSRKEADVLQKEAADQLTKLIDTASEFLKTGDFSIIDKLIF